MAHNILVDMSIVSFVGTVRHLRLLLGVCVECGGFNLSDDPDTDTCIECRIGHLNV